MTTSLKEIVIIGGGVSGLKLATQLGNKLGRNKKAKVILIDYNYGYLWKPLLHKVATGSVNESINTINYLAHARYNHFQFQLGTVVNINREKKIITLTSLYDENKKILLPERKINYDTLVIALGSVSNSFNIPGVKEYCVFLDNQNQASYLRRKILNLFFKYSNNSNTKINITIVGGGATGVELSAELHNLIKQLHNYGYKKVTNETFSITLVEAGERILPILPNHVSNIIHNKLAKLNIRILTQTMIINIDKDGLYTKKGEYIKSNLIIWAAGIKAPDFIKDINGLETNHINQLVVKPTLQTTCDPNIFAIGDCSSCRQDNNSFVPPRAQAAHQMADLVFYNILAQMRGNSLKTYVYKDYGSLISLSRYSIIGNLIVNSKYNSVVIRGCIARLIYISLYSIYLITLYGYFKTGLVILLNYIVRLVRPRLNLH